LKRDRSAPASGCD